MSGTTSVDFIIIGAGMAGAAAGYELAARGSVLVLEREDMPGRHSTGRSSALFDESYGKAAVRRLTIASRPFLQQPPANFCDHPLLSPRPMMVIGTETQQAALQAFYEDNQPMLGNLQWLDARALHERVPLLKDTVRQAVLSPGCMDMDVAAQHQGYLQGLRQRGGQLRVNAAPRQIRFRDGRWQVETDQGRFTAPWLINAAGAWVDAVAQQAGVAPLGFTPMRRTVVVVDGPADQDFDHWPMVMDAEEQFYFKPESGGILLTPADETPVEPHDVQPEELDMAIAVDRMEQVLDLEVRRLRHSWAGLRTFAPDRVLVIGEDPDHPGFFWLGGQGGYGIMTAPAASQLAASLIEHRELPDALRQAGVEASDYDPARLR